jgi:hypothetical protein
MVSFMVSAEFPAELLAGTPHAHPNSESQVPISGWPLYLENLEIGGPLSDYGSHAGIKAVVMDDRYQNGKIWQDHNNAMNVAYYGAFGGMAGQIDQSNLAIEVGSASQPTSWQRRLAPAQSRQIEFFPFGWIEQTEDSDFQLEGRIFTLNVDTLALAVRLTNQSGQPRLVRPLLSFSQDSDGIHESMFPLQIAPKSTSLAWNKADNEVRLDYVQTLSRPVGQLRLTRAIRPSFPLLRVWRSLEGGLTRIYLQGQEQTHQPGQMVEWFWVVGCAEQKGVEASNLARAGLTLLANSPWPRWEMVAREWAAFFDSAVAAHTQRAEERNLYHMALTALRMGLYKQRNQMPSAFCSLPGKVHFNYFWCWDTPFQTLGQKEMGEMVLPDGQSYSGVTVAQANLTTLLAAQVTSQTAHPPLTYPGMIYLAVDDTLTPFVPPSGNLMTQPPVSPWAVYEIARQAGLKNAQSWLAEILPKSLAHVEFYRQWRDDDGNGLSGYKNAMETGWDDTPRYPSAPLIPGSNLSGLKATNQVDALDLNCFLYQGLVRLAELLREMNDPVNAAKLSREAEDIRLAVEERMWNQERGTYFDLLRENGVETPVSVLTPVMAWPLFVGLTTDWSRAKSVIEKYLLAPDLFWGNPADPLNPRYPIPSVAYSDPQYDTAQQGYYWQGQVWLVPIYAVMTALYRYGYYDEALLLRQRVIDMVLQADSGGIHETYDAMSGEIGWGSGNGLQTGIGEPSVFQFGWSSALIAEILTDRYQAEVYLRPEQASVAGYIRKMTDPTTQTDFLRLTIPSADTPRLSLASLDGRPILQSSRLLLRLDDAGQLWPGAVITMEMDKKFRIEGIVRADTPKTRCSRLRRHVRYPAENRAEISWEGTLAAGNSADQGAVFEIILINN